MLGKVGLESPLEPEGQLRLLTSAARRCEVVLFQTTRLYSLVTAATGNATTSPRVYI